MNDYDNEAECEKIRIENGKVLDEFENYLSVKNLSTGTIKKHSGNIAFFINEFLYTKNLLGPTKA